MCRTLDRSALYDAKGYPSLIFHGCHVQVRYTPGLPGLKAFAKSSRPDLAPQLFDALARLLA